jgi:hypothetical protein
MITQELLNEIFDYSDGVLYRKNGAVAGCKEPYGYIRVSIKNKSYLAHRLIYLMHHGVVPDYIDHIDGDRANNRIENLRPCNRSQNTANSKSRSDSATKVKNVYFDKDKKKYRVTVRKDGVKHNGGYFANQDDAIIAAKQLREKVHKEFARHK